MVTLTFKQLRTMSEDEARDLLEAIRWPNGVRCPHCKSEHAFKLKPKGGTKTHVRAGVWKCSDCRKQFTAKIGTAFEGSKIPIRDWIMATYLICSSKKGMSSHQLHRTLGVTYKTAWFMTHRIRNAISQNHMEMLSGIVEVDETYIGGKEGNKHASKRLPSSQGRSYGKVPVVALLERGGRVTAKMVRSISGIMLRNMIRARVNKNSHLMTDEFTGYLKTGEGYLSHQIVTHSKGEYARGDVYTNTVEGWFALLKRGITGTFHHVSRKHLDRYIDEFTFRYNTRHETDGERTVKALSKIIGKQLTYNSLRFKYLPH